MSSNSIRFKKAAQQIVKAIFDSNNDKEIEEPTIFGLDEKERVIKVAFPIQFFEGKNLLELITK